MISADDENAGVEGGLDGAEEGNDIRVQLRSVRVVDAFVRYS